jgi:hypothetical protein
LRAVPTLQILYRGPLESCNYGCTYCPFAKRTESVAAVSRDRNALQRFVDWSRNGKSFNGRVDQLEILFTPWGEALHRARYQRAMAALTQAQHISFVGIQTNLSVVPSLLVDLPREQRSKITLWATWHPTQTSLAAFLKRVRRCRDHALDVSVGIVAERHHLAVLPEFADALTQAGTSLQWINAYKVGYRTPKSYYSQEEIASLNALDPWFEADLKGQRSGGKSCATGTSAIAIDGEGEVTRCHFVARELGNIYTQNLEDILAPVGTNQSCSRAECNCFQGYVHLQNTSVNSVFHGVAALRRVPSSGDS